MPGCLQSPCVSARDFPERLCCNLSGSNLVLCFFHSKPPNVLSNKHQDFTVIQLVPALFGTTLILVQARHPGIRSFLQKEKDLHFQRINAEFASLMEVTIRFELVNEGFADASWSHFIRICVQIRRSSLCKDYSKTLFVISAVIFFLPIFEL